MKHNHLIPAAATTTITQVIEEQKTTQAEIEKLSTQLNALVQKRTELQGKINGILTGIAVVAGFDTNKDIHLSEDLTTLVGELVELV